MTRDGNPTTVVLDHQSEHLERLRVYGLKVFFGDVTRPDLLHAAGIEKAKMLIIAIDDKEQSTELVRYVKEHYPHVYMVVRAVDRHHVYELWDAGARDIIREHFDSAVRAARSALEALGLHPYDAEQQSKAYVDNDKRAMRELAELYDSSIPAHENEPYVEAVRKVMVEQEEAMRGQSARFGSRVDRGWVPPTLDDLNTAIDENAAAES